MAKVNRLSEVLWRKGASSEEAIQTRQAKTIALCRTRPEKEFNAKKRATVARREDKYLMKVRAARGSGVMHRNVSAIKSLYIEELGRCDWRT
jgi:hypothetical protein